METRIEYSPKAMVCIRKGQGRSLKAGGAWIYDNEIESVNGAFENGDMVTVEDFDGYPLGTGFINTKSKLTVRMMSRRKDTVIDSDFLEMRVRSAWDYRKAVTDTSSCRVIFGEADFLPGIVIDKFSDVLVVESLALGIDRLKPVIVDKLKKVMAEDGITIRGVYERSDAKVRLQEGMERHKGFMGDAFDTKVEILENGVRYMVDVEDGQKTGFFLDQKAGCPESLPPHPAKAGAGLLYPHRVLCPQCRSGRVRTCAGRGRLGAGSKPGQGKRCPQRPDRTGSV